MEMGTFLQLLVFLWIFFPYLFVSSHPTVQCAHTGSALSVEWKQRRGWKLRQGQFTIGARNIDSIYGGAMYSGFVGNIFGWEDFFMDGLGYEKKHCPYNYQPHDNIWTYGRSVGELELCDEQYKRVILRVNAVQQTDSAGIKHTLPGWLHLEVELKNKTDE